MSEGQKGFSTRIDSPPPRAPSYVKGLHQGLRGKILGLHRQEGLPDRAHHVEGVPAPRLEPTQFWDCPEKLLATHHMTWKGCLHQG
jgi:hypothetical protein